MEDFTSISSLTGEGPFNRSIKVFITSKSDTRKERDNQKSMRIIKMYFKDESGEIQATVFDELIDKLDVNSIEVGKSYKITNFHLKRAHEKYCKLKHSCEIHFTKDTFVEECTSAVMTFSTKSEFNIVPISSVKEEQVDSHIDVVAVCQEVLDTDEDDKKEVVLCDHSDEKISLFVWGDQAVKFMDNIKSIVLIKKARVKTFQGRLYLTLADVGNVQFIPDIPEVRELILCTYYKKENI